MTRRSSLRTVEEKSGVRPNASASASASRSAVRRGRKPNWRRVNSPWTGRREESADNEARRRGRGRGRRRVVFGIVVDGSWRRYWGNMASRLIVATKPRRNWFESNLT
mmetsp:Transcript_3400/g.7194  ORF Transcript_3400/g.7194 Transcript_3400/m.7194 type:complete len:108 (-) Transcript_3400:72-395(-)